jgi:NAD(P)H-hydrate epimerase
VPILTGSEAARFDRTAIDELGVPEAALMESAGRAAADLAGDMAGGGPVVALAGGGNNGGDALVAARTLAARRHRVRVILTAERAADDPLLHGWPLDVRPAAEMTSPELLDVLGRAGVLLDGILGTGISGAPREPQARVIELVNRSGVPILSLDIASGVDADRGAVPGAAVMAHTTLAFGWPKLGSLLAPGRSFSGRVLAAEIGFPPLPAPASTVRLLTPAWGGEVRPRRAPDTHKNRVGALTLVAGGMGMAGAAILAARAALRAGAGYVRVASAPENRDVMQTALPDVPWVDLGDPDAVRRALEAATAVAVGPGLGTDARARTALERVLAGPRRPLVLDADALNLIASGAGDVTPVADDGRPVVLTPHPGEMARLMDTTVGEIQGDRPRAARTLASRLGTTVLLKGMPSLVAAPDGRLDVAGVVSSDLAVAGMGDVLTGTIGALLAQGLAPGDAAGLGLLVGGLAARSTGRGPGLASGDVPDALPAAFRILDGELDPPRHPWATLELEAPS